MRLYLVRHGESVANATNGLERTTETPLSERGIGQAEVVADRFVGVPLDHLYTSASVRTTQTGEILSRRTGAPLERWPELGEITADETFDAVSARAASVLDRLVRDHAEQTIVCVSHATMIETIVARAVFGEGLTTTIIDAVRMHFGTTNTGITICEWTQKDGWMLMTFNGSSHLA